METLIRLLNSQNHCAIPSLLPDNLVVQVISVVANKHCESLVAWIRNVEFKELSGIKNELSLDLSVIFIYQL